MGSWGLKVRSQVSRLIQTLMLADGYMSSSESSAYGAVIELRDGLIFWG